MTPHTLAPERIYYVPGPPLSALHWWRVIMFGGGGLTLIEKAPPNTLLLAGPHVCPRGWWEKLPSQLALSMDGHLLQVTYSRSGRSTPLVLILCQDHATAISFPSPILAGAPW